jgi:transposase
MDFLLKEQVRGEVLDHLGIIAVTLDKLKLIDKINERLAVSKNKGSKICMGKRLAAMILNGLGFIDDRLYLFPKFLANKPVDRLLGEGIKAEDFNDDALGRFLDAVYEYGTTKLFTEMAFEVGIEQGLLGQTAHFDTSTLSVYGEYENEEEATTENTKGSAEEEKERINITYGYSKDKRYDLKQMVINLATTGASGFPIWMEAHSGNASDKTVLIHAAKRMKKFCQFLKDAPDFLYVGDSAFYENAVKHAGYQLSFEKSIEKIQGRTLYLSFAEGGIKFSVLDNKDGILKTKLLSKELFAETDYQKIQDYFSRDKQTPNEEIHRIIFTALSSFGYYEPSDMKWISRVPSSIKEAKALLCQPQESFVWIAQGDGYEITPISSWYGGIHQRWILVYSKQAFDRELATLNKNVEKENKNLVKALRALSKERFECESDAKKATECCIEKIKYHQIDFKIVAETVKKTTAQEESKVQYRIFGIVKKDEEKIAIASREKGRFILATNELDSEKLADCDILSEYKGQSKTESGFKFIKGHAFEVASVFLKKPERIEALMMVMTLCLMVYSFAQHFLCESLKHSDETLPNQLGKPTQKPSMAWVFRLFHGVHLLTIQFADKVQKLVINLTKTTEKVIEFFGGKAKWIYGLCESG